MHLYALFAASSAVVGSGFIVLIDAEVGRPFAYYSYRESFLSFQPVRYRR